MKILLINKFNFPNRGADRHYLDQASLLRSKGHEVAVFSMDSPKNIFSPWKKYFVSYVGFRDTDLLWHRLKGYLRIYSWEAKRKIRRLLDDFQPEIVHIHNIYHHISPSILPEIKKRGIPIIMTVHDYHLVSPDYLLGTKKNIWASLSVKKFINFIRLKSFKNSYLKSFMAASAFTFYRFSGIYERNIDLYISPSEYTKKILLASGIDREKIIVIPHFTKNEEKKYRFENQKEKYAIYAGSISDEKGVGELINIFRNIPRVELRLAGNIEPDFDMDWPPNVKYVGFINRSELQKQIRNSLFVVSASGLPETFGLIALEAMSEGKPFIGLDSGAYGEIVKDGKSGYLCKNMADMKQKIEFLATDMTLRGWMARNAFEVAKSFESQRYYESLISTYDTLIRGSAKNLTTKPYTAYMQGQIINL